MLFLVSGCGRSPRDIPDMNATYHDHAVEGKASISPEEKRVKDQALQDVKRRLKESPNDPKLIDRYVHLALDARPHEAVEACDALLEKDPDNEYALVHKGVALMELGKLDKAHYYASLSITKHPKLPEGHVLLGHLHYRAGRIPKARAAFEAALDLQSNHADAQAGINACNQSN